MVSSLLPASLVGPPRAHEACSGRGGLGAWCRQQRGIRDRNLSAARPYRSTSRTAGFWLSITWLQGTRYLDMTAEKGHRIDQEGRTGLGKTSGQWSYMAKPGSKRKLINNPSTAHGPSNAQALRALGSSRPAIPQPCPNRYLRTSCSRTSSQLRFRRVLKRLRETMQSWGVGEEGGSHRKSSLPSIYPMGTTHPTAPGPTNHSQRTVHKVWHITVIQVLNKLSHNLCRKDFAINRQD